ncbi:cation diffusion facilitator family transporter [Salirhabdus euzebyi]|uniref:Cation diffusion facilitator family transporter n=1 Tax=Salirhabdus euzebyi TaxID=394506 RepID=A0A841Q8J3_9BACI|nr:cation diffusion facilitator family transporter [Salirhabdus euzebyi]MBB6454643.1 cation diffusion facilitator family transporter [Salirhabdus euzebyi]
MQEYDNLKRGEKGAWLSISAYLVLSALKLTVAYIGGSAALRADGLNNATDVVASVAVLIGLKISRKPPDKDHHYGHYRAESIASLIAAFIMITVGLEVVINTVTKLIQNQTETPSIITAYAAGFSAIVMFGVYRFNRKLAKNINSSAIYAQSQDNLSDALVSIGAVVGILGSIMGVHWLDLVAGILVGLLIIKTAVGIFWDATHTLTDGFDSKEIKEIKKSISNVHGVEKVKDIKARKHGNQVLLEATILVNPQLTVEESHHITDEVEIHLEKKYGVKHAHLHIEPYPS